MTFHGRRVTVMGLGHFGGGAAAARWLARRGAVVTVTDLADEHTLADSLAALEGEPIAEFHLGGHREQDFRGAELLVVNPAVRPGNPLLTLARDAGTRLSSEIELFLQACPAPVIAVTGSNGKSTTAAMTAAILEADGRRTWLGGNLGGSLLDHLERIGPDDRVVLELSSFQLWHLGPNVAMPKVAVITNCSPNHLDWHGSYECYVAAKQRMLSGQDAAGLAVLNTHDAEVASWGHLLQGRQVPPATPGELPQLNVPGLHNRINAACAAAAATAMGCERGAVRRGLQSFLGLPQRLERFAVIDGRTFYNDSTSTTPESTVAALQSLQGRVWLLAGGSDKGCELIGLIRAIARRARGAAFFGTVRDQLRRELLAARPDFACTSTEHLAGALRWCWDHSRHGDAILLSPACASGDQFRNFRRRGEKFVELVHTLPSRAPTWDTCQGSGLW